jgi:hypothetical protein
MNTLAVFLFFLGLLFHISLGITGPFFLGLLFRFFCASRCFRVSRRNAGQKSWLICLALLFQFILTPCLENSFFLFGGFFWHYVFSLF